MEVWIRPGVSRTEVQTDGFLLWVAHQRSQGAHTRSAELTTNIGIAPPTAFQPNDLETRTAQSQKLVIFNRRANLQLHVKLPAFNEVIPSR